MDIKLDGIELSNFKGVQSFALVPAGKNATIRGDNATGKTTLIDAFMWLLFGKDSRGRSDFQLKAVDGAGNEAHNLDHSVEAVLLVDGKPLGLKKVFKEKWTKKRGQSRAEFTGHTTDHYIDGVPAQKKEWDQRIAETINEDTFKLLTSPSYFNNLHWQKRREILLQVCGDVEDAEVISSDKALASLPDILNGQSLEDHKKVVAARRKEINKRLEEIPARIDELTKSMSDAPRNPKAVEAEIAHLQHKLEKVKDDSEGSALRKEAAGLEAELAELKGQRDKVRRHATEDLEKELEAAKKSRRALGSEIEDIEGAIRKAKAAITENEKRMEALRAEYNEEAANEYEGKGTCPTCGQALPEGQVEAARARHNESKAQVLADINKKGRGLKEQNAEIGEALEKDEEKLKEKQGDAEIADAEIRKLEAEIEVIEPRTPKLDSEIEAIEENIETLRQKIEARPKTDTTALEREINEAQGRLADYRATEKGKLRVGELEAEEKALAKEFEGLEREAYLMDQFVISKVGMLEERIASQFETVRFKMFEQQINGGISETCITTVDGVPYGSGLNNGAEINAGLDIIRTLSRHYGITAPVWVDNAEAVTRLLPLDAQTIKLVVSPDHPEMEVEYHE